MLLMITNPSAYRSLDDGERWEALRRMTPEESIALGEALLTSEIMEQADFADDDRPMCLAVALGIRRRYVETPPCHGSGR
jgi:hypothetical protein